MKDKLIILLFSTLSLLMYSCNSSTEPDDEQVILTGKIVFTSSFGGEEVIYTINPDGTDLKKLLNAPLSLLGPPKWSPDGTQIAFLGRSSYTSQTAIYLMDADGKNVKRLTQYGAIAYYLWEPSGQSIIFSVGRQSSGVTTNGIGRVDTAGNLLQFVDLKASTFPLGTLSNDGKKLAFSLDGEIQILDFESKSMQKLLVNGYAGMKYYPVDWSIDDKELLTISATLDGTHSNLDMINIKKGTFNRLLQDYKILALDWLK